MIPYVDFIRYTLPKMTEEQLRELEDALAKEASELRLEVYRGMRCFEIDLMDINEQLHAVRIELCIREVSLNECTTQALIDLRKKGVGKSILAAIDTVLMRRGIV